MGETLTRKDVALLLKVSERQVTRLVASKKLRRESDGSFDNDEVELYLAGLSDGEGEESDKRMAEAEAANLALAEALASTQKHVNQLVGALLTMSDNSNRSLVTANKDLLARDEVREGKHVEMLSALGELLMHKDERSARMQEAAARSQQLGKMGDTVVSFLPKLMSQAGGKTAAFELLANMSDDEKKALPAIAEFFSSPKAKAAFPKVLEAMGLDLSTLKSEPKPEAEEKAE